MDADPGARYNSAVTAKPTISAYPGLYDEGDGQGPRDVFVRPAPTRLEIRDRRGLPLTHWPYAEVTLDTSRDAEAMARAIHLTRRGRPKLALSVFDPALVRDLRPLLQAAQTVRPRGKIIQDKTPAPPARRTGFPRIPWHRLAPSSRVKHSARALAWGAGLLGVGIGLYAAVAATAPLIATRIAPSIPLAWSTTWGATLAATAGARCDAPAGREALEALVGRLEAAAGPGAPALDVGVIDDPSVEARALPGGHILLTRGLLEALRTPDELAGVLAHAVADARAHGPTRVLLGQLRPGELFTVWRDGAQTSPALLSTALSRAHPKPADLAPTDVAAIAMLHDAGLRTRGLAAVHDVLGSLAARDERPPLYLRSHPIDDTRLKRLRAVPAGGAMALSWDRWQAVRTMCQPAIPPVRRGMTG